MKDERKTKKELISELAEVRQRITELEAAETEQKWAEEALRESEERFRLAFEDGPLGMGIVGSDLRLLRVNKVFCEMLGYTEQQLTGVTFVDITHPDDVEKDLQLARQAFKGEIPGYKLEKRYIMKNQEIVWIDLTATVVRDPNGKALYGLAMVENITERKRAEQRLKESEGKLNAMLHSIGDHMSMMDKDLNIVWANQTAQKVFGDDIIGNKCYEVYHQRKKPCEPYPCVTLKAFQDGKVHGHDTQVISKDGRILHFHCTANVALKDEEGKPTAVMEISRDITSWKEAEAALRESEEFSSSLLSNSPNPIKVINQDTSVRYVNPALEKLTGFSSAELIGKKAPYPWWTEETLQKTGRDLEEAMGQGATRVEELFQKKNGERFWVEITSTPVRSNGHFKYYLANWVDITDRKKAEQALRESESLLREMSARMREVEECERRELARELHDRVGQSLTALNINLNIILSQLSEESKDKTATRLHDSMTLVEEITKHTRDVMAELHPELLDEYGLMAALNWYCDRFSQRTGITTEIKGEETSTRPSRTVESVLFRVAQETLTNVSRHAQASKVTVSLEDVDGLMRLTIADDGRGFDPNAFTKPKDQVGWGLITMQERVRALGGKFHLESKPWKGTQVTIELGR